MTIVTGSSAERRRDGVPERLGRVVARMGRLRRRPVGRHAGPGSPGSFVFTLECQVDADEAWRRIADVRGHGAVVPFTRGSGPAPQDLRVGSRLVAHTGIGPLGFDDVMVVVRAAVGRELVLEKVGDVIGGVVDVRFFPSTPGHSRLVWHQSIEVPWLRGPLAPIGRRAARIAAPVVALGYRRTVQALLREPTV